MTVPFGGALTATATVPPDALIDGGDRFAEKRNWWPKLALAAFLVWWLHAYVVGAWHFDRNWMLHPVQSWEDASARDVAAKEALLAQRVARKSGAAGGTNVVEGTNLPPAKP
jgi:hypothetical protein